MSFTLILPPTRNNKLLGIGSGRIFSFAYSIKSAVYVDPISSFFSTFCSAQSARTLLLLDVGLGKKEEGNALFS